MWTKKRGSPAKDGLDETESLMGVWLANVLAQDPLALRRNTAAAMTNTTKASHG
jgi:hypothetical protein